MFLLNNQGEPGFYLWQYDAQRQAEARARGVIFGADELMAIMAFWRGLIVGAPAHDLDGLRLRLQSGGAARITPTEIDFEDREPTAAELRASMAHAAALWGGSVAIAFDPTTSREFRLKARAYAEVYGVELDDPNDAFADGRLTSAELARLPALRAQVRADHQDAPPARPDESGRLTAVYARRYPFRIAAAA